METIDRVHHPPLQQRATEDEVTLLRREVTFLMQPRQKSDWESGDNSSAV